MTEALVKAAGKPLCAPEKAQPEQPHSLAHQPKQIGAGPSTFCSHLYLGPLTVPLRGPPHGCRYNGGGATEEVQALSSMRGGGMGRNDRRAFLSTIKDEGLGMDGQGQTLQVGRVP